MGDIRIISESKRITSFFFLYKFNIQSSIKIALFYEEVDKVDYEKQLYQVPEQPAFEYTYIDSRTLY